MFKPITWMKKKVRKAFSKNPIKVKDPWGKKSKVPAPSKKGPLRILPELEAPGLKWPKIELPEYPRFRIPGLAYIKMLVSAFVFLNMIFLILGMIVNFLPTPMNQYIMWLFILMAFISLDHIWMKRKVLRSRAQDNIVFRQASGNVGSNPTKKTGKKKARK